MCELYEEQEKRIPCEAQKNIFDVIFYGVDPKKQVKEHDYSQFRNCPECHRKSAAAGFPYRHHLVKPVDQVKMDNGEVWCLECVSKLV